MYIIYYNAQCVINEKSSLLNIYSVFVYKVYDYLFLSHKFSDHYRQHVGRTYFRYDHLTYRRWAS